MMNRRLSVFPVLLLIAAYLSGCGGGSDKPSTPPRASLVSIAISPKSFSTGVGIARQLTATGSYADGSTANITSNATWQTAAPSVATVTTSGVATGVALGSTTVTATSGGVSQSIALAVTTNVWSPAASMLDRRGFHTATLLANGKVLAVGGVYPSGNNTAELYDPGADAWSSAPNMVKLRSGHTATLLNNNKVLVTGGINALVDCEVYDPAANAWSAVASMGSTRTYHTATKLPDGKVLVVGGDVDGNGFIYNSSSEIYDPALNTWTPGALMVNARGRHIATLLPNGTVLVAGGWTGGAAGILASAEIYDPPANTWTSAASMVHARGDHTATLLKNGTVLAAGGDYATDATAEIYDPVANTWTSAGNMAEGRDHHTATLLPNGSVLVAGGLMSTGGVLGPTPLASAEIYDPIANAWSPAGSMSHGREEHTATLLPNNTLLVTGSGVSVVADPDAPSSCELYW